MTAVLTPDSPTGPALPTHVTQNDGLREPTRLHWMIALWSVCVLPFSVNVVDPDLWGHVQYAQDWIAEGALPRVSSHNFTAEGYPWVNHENLSELFLAIGFGRLGIIGMSLIKFSAGICLLLAAWWNARKHNVTIGTYWIVAALAAYALHPFWLFRPQMATWLGLATMVWLLNEAFRDWHNKPDHRIRWRYLFGLVPLFVLWTNAHGGFLAGLCMLGAYLFGRCAEIFLSKNPCAANTSLKLAGLGIVVGAVTLLNPYGIELHQWLVHSLGEARPEIIEWHRPTILAPVFAPFFGLVLLSLLAWVASERRRDWTHGLVLLVTLAQALLHIRHIALFAILALFWLPPHVNSLVENCFKDLRERTNSWLRNQGSAFAVICCFCIFAVTAFWNTKRLVTLPVKSNSYPVQAIQFMHDNDINGRLVVSFNWAQYAIATLQPKTKVSFDGRFRTCYPQHIIDKHFDLMVGDVPELRNRAADTPFDPVAILREGDPELVLLDRKQFPYSVEVLTEQCDDFTLLYEDSVSQLWGKRARFGDVPAVQGRQEFPDVPWPAIPNASKVASGNMPLLDPTSQSDS